MDPNVILTFPLEFKGSLKEMFDSLTSQLSLSWRYRNGGVEIYRHATKSFVFNALPGSSSYDTNVTNAVAAGSQSEDGSSSSNTSHSTSHRGSMAMWDNIADAMDHMVSFDGRYVVQESLGRITVTDTPKALARVKDYIDEMNASISTKIMVRAEVYEVSLRGDSAYGIDWNAVFSRSTKLGLTLASNISNATANLTATVLKPTASWVDSQVMARALSEQGNVRLLTTASLVTTNGIPAPLQVATETTYLAKSSVTTEDDAISVELEPGTVSDGFSMNLLPKVQENGDLMLQYSVDMRSLDSIERIEAGGTAIQVPQVSTQNFVQRATIRSGQTLMLAGFERMRDQNYAGSIVPNGATVILGGERETSQSRSVTVIMLTPFVIDR
jgi:type IVB pilus formation R64 PilN family outer membrane protein